MRILINPLHRVLLPYFPTKKTRIRNKEHLLFRPLLQPRQELRGLFLFNFFPGMKSCAQAPSIRNILAQSKSAVDVEGVALRGQDAEVGILVHEAFSFEFESVDGGRVPPVGVVAGFVVVAAAGIEGCGARSVECWMRELWRYTVCEFMAAYRAKRTVADIRGKAGVVEDGGLHDACWEDDLVSRRIVIGPQRG